MPLLLLLHPPDLAAASEENPGTDKKQYAVLLNVTQVRKKWLLYGRE